MTCQREKKGKGEGVTRQLLRYETQCWRWKVLRCAIWICSWMTNSAEFKQNKMFLLTCLASNFLDFSQYCVSCVYLSFLSEIPFISQVMNMITDMWEKQLGSGKTYERTGVHRKMEISPHLILTAEAIVSFFLAQEGSGFRGMGGGCLSPFFLFSLLRSLANHQNIKWADEKKIIIAYYWFIWTND